MDFGAAVEHMGAARSGASAWLCAACVQDTVAMRNFSVATFIVNVHSGTGG
jgi:hypothetical protein